MSNIHKFRLYFLRNRMDIVISILLLLAITSTSITFAILFKLQEQNRKQEDLLKAVACILLIVPEDRKSVV